MGVIGVIADGYKPSDDEPFMNDRQKEYFRRKLIAWRESILAESKETLAALQNESENHPDIADRASSETDRAIELRARDRQRKLIAKIEAALARIDDGSYGYCIETGEPISLRRLDARPIATLSVEAQERHERREKDLPRRVSNAPSGRTVAAAARRGAGSASREGACRRSAGAPAGRGQLGFSRQQARHFRLERIEFGERIVGFRRAAWPFRLAVRPWRRAGERGAKIVWRPVGAGADGGGSRGGAPTAATGGGGASRRRGGRRPFSPAQRPAGFAAATAGSGCAACSAAPDATSARAAAGDEAGGLTGLGAPSLADGARRGREALAGAIGGGIAAAAAGRGRGR